MRPSLPRFAAALLVLALASATAGADTLSHTVSVPLQATDWYIILNVPQFNPALGTLSSVTVEVRDSLVHKVEFENRSLSSTSRFRDSTYVTVDVLRLDSSPIVTAIAKIYRTDLVGIFDGIIDYAGTSGITVDGLTDEAVSSSTLTAPDDLALFTGTETVELPCQASAWFMFSYSGGNATYRLTTQAQAVVHVTYTYDSVVPTQPTTWGKIKSLYR